MNPTQATHLYQALSLCKEALERALGHSLKGIRFKHQLDSLRLTLSKAADELTEAQLNLGAIHQDLPEKDAPAPSGPGTIRVRAHKRVKTKKHKEDHPPATTDQADLEQADLEQADLEQEAKENAELPAERVIRGLPPLGENQPGK